MVCVSFLQLFKDETFSFCKFGLLSKLDFDSSISMTGPMKMALSVLAKLALQEVTAEIKNGTTMHGPTTNQIIGGALRIVPKCGTMEVGLARGM